MIKKGLLTLVISTILANSAYAETETFKKDQVKEILNSSRIYQGESFNQFVDYTYKNTKLSGLKNSINLYKKNALKFENDMTNIYRLMGIYSRLKYKKEMMNMLSELVSIKTDKLDNISQYKNPNIIKFGNTIKNISDKLGLEYHNYNNHIFEVTLKGKTGNSFGVYTHSDVVPADPTKWILENGTKLSPYKMQIIGDKIYGRGTEDDKCSIVSSLFAMKTIKDSGIKLNRNIRLLIETTEETSGEGIEYFKKSNKLPDYNIVLDSSYPLVVAEKGFGSVSAVYKIEPIKNNTNQIIGLTGGLAYNQIPSTSVITIKTSEPEKLTEIIKVKADEYIKANDNNFKIKTEIINKDIKITVIGKSAHSAGPANGINPVARACNFISSVSKDLNLENNSFKMAADFISDNFGLDYYGKKLGVDFKDQFMGPMTMSPTLVKIKNGELEVAVNIRAPKGKEPQVLKKEIETALNVYQAESGNNFALHVETSPYMYRDLKGKWINTLLSTFGEVTGKEAKPVSISGSTTAKQLPNGVCFGPAMPGEVYTGHTDNEFKKVDNFLFDLQMFTEMFARIGNLEKME